MSTRRIINLSLAVAVIFSLLVANFAFAQANSGESTRVIVQLAGPVTASDKAFMRGLGGSIVHEYSLVPAMALELPTQALKALERNPRVVLIEEDMEVQAVFFDDEYLETWSISNVKARPVHDSGNTGVGVKVGIIDSGIDYTHPDLEANYRGGKNFISRGKPSSDPIDVWGHGTHVAGTVCASMNSWGAVGVAPDCELYALKVLNDNGSGQTSDILASVEWAVAQGLDVINLSLGSTGNPGATAEAVYQAAYDAGLMIVAAGGNSGTTDTTAVNTIWPANYSSVIAVAATDQNNNRAWFSSTGPNVELAAPGLAVHSTWNDSTSQYDPQPTCDNGTRGCYKDASGTSMASPQVAGVAALIISTRMVADTNGNGRINDEVRAIMNNTARDLGTSGKDNVYGHGLVDASAAVAAVGPIGPQAPVADAGADQTHEVAVGETVAITLNGSGSEANNDPLSYYWTGGDILGTSTGAEYGTSLGAGTYVYTLTVSDGELQGTDTVTVEVIEVSPNQLPVADFSHLTNGGEVTFTDTSSDPDGSIVSWNWNFGDGNTVNVQNPIHTYTTSGTYNVSLTVTDDRGDSSEITKDVTVEVVEPPAPDVVLSYTSEKVRGTKFVYLTWTPADIVVDVYRDGTVVSSNDGDGAFEEDLGKGGGSYTYQVCKSGSVIACSAEAIVTF